jgi:hypothetical protein
MNDAKDALKRASQQRYGARAAAMPAIAAPVHMADGGFLGKIASLLPGGQPAMQRKSRLDAAIDSQTQSAPAPAPAPQPEAPPKPFQFANGGAKSILAGTGGSHQGLVTGPGTGTSDSVPARYSAGEYVLPADTTAAIGVDNLDAIKDATHTPVAQPHGKRVKKLANGGILAGTDDEVLSADGSTTLYPTGGRRLRAPANPKDQPQYQADDTRGGDASIAAWANNLKPTAAIAAPVAAPAPAAPSKPLDLSAGPKITAFGGRPPMPLSQMATAPAAAPAAAQAPAVSPTPLPAADMTGAYQRMNAEATAGNRTTADWVANLKPAAPATPATPAIAAPVAAPTPAAAAVSTAGAGRGSINPPAADPLYPTDPGNGPQMPYGEQMGHVGKAIIDGGKAITDGLGWLGKTIVSAPGYGFNKDAAPAAPALPTQLAGAGPTLQTAPAATNPAASTPKPAIAATTPAIAATPAAPATAGNTPAITREGNSFTGTGNADPAEEAARVELARAQTAAQDQRTSNAITGLRQAQAELAYSQGTGRKPDKMPKITQPADPMAIAKGGMELQSQAATMTAHKQLAKLQQQLINEPDTTKARQLQNKILALQGKTPETKVAIVDSDTGAVDVMGNPVYKKMAVNVTTGEFLTPPAPQKARMSAEQALQQARAAVEKGADKAAVNARLKELGHPTI